MRVLLISANTEMINMSVLPMGLGCIAIATQEAGHEIKIINLMEQEDVFKALGVSISEFEPEVIGISVRNIDDQVMAAPRFLLEPVKSMITFCRDHTDSTIVIGGAGYSIFPQNALEYADSLDLESMKVTAGIRIYPNTLLAQQAIKEGLIKSNDNLLFPEFYVSKDLRFCLQEMVNEWTQNRFNWLQ